MARFLALFLSVLVLLQTFSRELTVLDYQVHREQVTRLFCVNKDKPKMQCNGRCHLVKQLRKAGAAESKAPASGYAKIKYEVLPPALAFVAAAPAAVGAAAALFAPRVASHYTFTPAHSIFHPPAFQV